jgi:hypothetical protein
VDTEESLQRARRIEEDEPGQPQETIGHHTVAIAEIEDATALFGKDYFPYGVEQSRKDIQALCDEQYAQGLVSQQVDAAIAFPDSRHR